MMSYAQVRLRILNRVFPDLTRMPFQHFSSERNTVPAKDSVWHGLEFKD